MIDWSRDNEVTQNTPEQFIWHQMVLSLLYDDVLAQDETFLCSDKMAKWFSTDENSKLLDELFACGGLSVLKRPKDRYPDNLKGLANCTQ